MFLARDTKCLRPFVTLLHVYSRPRKFLQRTPVELQVRELYLICYPKGNNTSTSTVQSTQRATVC